MALLSGLTTSRTSVMPPPAATATTRARVGVATPGARSWGTALGNGRNRVPRPAAGIRALRTRPSPIARGYRGKNGDMQDADAPAARKAALRSSLLAARRARGAQQLEPARRALRSRIVERVLER